MRVLVSGVNGMVGTGIRELLEGRGDEVAALGRGRAATGLDVAWDPAGDTIDSDALASGEFDAVIHLAGEPLDGRWTDDKRVAIRDSRVNGTSLLANALASLDQKPKVFAVASATGFFGDRDEEVLTEQSAPGGGFLAGVVQEWEAAADPARDAGIRTVHVRMSAVQSRAGGALKQLLLPFRLGLGGRIGSGRQWMPWVGLTEAANMWAFALDNDAVDGPVNAIGPTPIRNSEYVRALGRVLGRPTLVPTPVPAVKLKFGSQLVDEMLLYSQKAVPARLEALGYEFLDRTITDALRRELGR